jgi:tRNA (cytidine56-2'-O)-methyltransferase
MRIVVLRLGHRPERDKRITTHVGLVSRALGAEEMLLTGKDDGVVASLEDVTKRWGGGFRVRQGVRWKEELRSFKDAGGLVVHLTMYGQGLPQVMGRIRVDASKSGSLMVVVGAEKVPGELYQLADWNLAVGNQPHSEVAALAIFLDRLQEGSWEEREYPGGLRIMPSPRGKVVVSEEATGKPNNGSKGQASAGDSKGWGRKGDAGKHGKDLVPLAWHEDLPHALQLDAKR